VGVLGGLPVDDLLGAEPEGDLAGGALGVGVGSVDDVAANIDSVVATDGPWGAEQGVGGTNEGTGSGNHSLSLPDHGDNGARGQEANQSIKEGLSLVLSIVALSDLLGGLDSLQGNELESLLLELGDDGTNQSTLHTIRLDSNESPFSGHFVMILELQEWIT